MPHKIEMPSLSADMTEATLARWIVSEGTEISAGDALAEVETDKATMEIEADVTGLLHKVLVSSGTDNVAVGAPIAIILLEGETEADLEEDVESVKQSAPNETGANLNSNSQEMEKAPSATISRPSGGEMNTNGTVSEGRIFASPLARVVARDNDIDLAGLAGSGPRGRIRKADVLAAVAVGREVEREVVAPTNTPPKPNTEHNPMPWQAHTARKNTNLRKTIARRLTEAKQNVPHFYLKSTAQIDRLLALRSELNSSSSARAKISVNDLIIKAAALALAEYPNVNAMWRADDILLFDDVDVSVAVSTDGGLLTPVIRKADQKSLSTISNEMKALATSARDGSLKPEQYQGGGFSISNLGMFGVEEFAAIINPPQSAILAVGAGTQRLVPQDGQAVVRTVMSLTLSVDHRCVDGAMGAQFLAVIKDLLEEPMRILA